MPKNPDKVLTGMDYHSKGHHFNLKRSSRRLPSPTITAMGNLAGTAGVCHYKEDRKFTIKELKRIMSLPEDFILTGEQKKQSERIGRMVPPLMMKALAESVYNNILKPYKEKYND
jgi:DNA (cytosine-5)-methyltransferase 1